MGLGGVEIAAVGSEVFQTQFIHESRPHLGEFQRHAARIAGYTSPPLTFSVRRSRSGPP